MRNGYKRCKECGKVKYKRTSFKVHRMSKDGENPIYRPECIACQKEKRKERYQKEKGFIKMSKERSKLKKEGVIEVVITELRVKRKEIKEAEAKLNQINELIKSAKNTLNQVLSIIKEK